ncbi:Zn-ribbon domain-containing OB-fold protein [Desertibaculum subflavum]|uniref:Zn-ribbon domain-containing OB-fold protein n=1 Tax=Desertibaculum subflavum TaxID=2268458 RepID=UPI000E667A17
MSSPGPLPLPAPNADSAAYWAGAKAGKLLLQRCRDCGATWFMSRHLCASCWSEQVESVEASGRGRVHSFTVIHRAPSAAFAGQVPYVVALIDLAEGPRMLANIVGAGAREIAIGELVRVTFEQRGDGALPQFQRAP